MRSIFFILTVSAFALSGGHFAMAEKKESDDRSSLIQMQEKMAKLRADAATCLKTQKSVSDCRGEMMKQCSAGISHCKMMSKMMSDGMMGHGMMKEQEDEKSDKQ